VDFFFLTFIFHNLTLEG